MEALSHKVVPELKVHTLHFFTRLQPRRLVHQMLRAKAIEPGSIFESTLNTESIVHGVVNVEEPLGGSGRVESRRRLM